MATHGNCVSLNILTDIGKILGPTISYSHNSEIKTPLTPAQPSYHTGVDDFEFETAFTAQIGQPYWSSGEKGYILHLKAFVN